VHRERIGQWRDDGHCEYVHCSCGGRTRYEVSSGARWERQYVVALTTCPLVERDERDWTKLRAKLLPAARVLQP